MQICDVLIAVNIVLAPYLIAMRLVAHIRCVNIPTRYVALWVHLRVKFSFVCIEVFHDISKEKEVHFLNLVFGFDGKGFIATRLQTNNSAS